MQKVKVESGKKTKVLPPKKGRKTFAIRVLSFNSSVSVHVGNLQMNLPGHECWCQINLLDAWDKDIEVSCENDADIEILEDE